MAFLPLGLCYCVSSYFVLCVCGLIRWGGIVWIRGLFSDGTGGVCERGLNMLGSWTNVAIIVCIRKYFILL
jgi:hypothetical protein